MLLEYIYTAIFGACNAYIIYFFFETFLPQKGWKLSQVDILLIISGVVQRFLEVLIDLALPAPNILRMVFSLIINIAYFGLILIPLSGSVKKRALLILLAFAIVVCSEGLAVGFNGLLINDPDVSAYKESYLNAQIIVLSALFLVLIVASIRFFAIHRSSRAKKAERGNRLIYILAIAIPVLSVAVFGYLISVGQATTAGVLILLVNTIALYLIFVQHYRAAVEYALHAEIQQLKEQHYTELEAHQTEIRTIKHDIKNQLIAMGAFVKTGDTERADRQLGRLIQQLEESSSLLFTDNAGINGLLARKYKEAEGGGIECDFGVSLPAATGFADVDLTVLLGNILDNAMEASSRCVGQRYIRLEVQCYGDVLVIHSENCTDGRAQSIETRKKDTLWHGLGMESIKQVVAKYNGQMKYHFSEDHFTIDLSLFPRE